MVYTGPTYVGKSTAFGDIIAGDIDFTSSGRVAGSLLHIVVTSANQAISAPTGFVELPTDSPQGQGTAGSSGGVAIALFEKISDGTETTVNIGDTGDFQYAVGFVYPPGTVVEASAGNDEALSGSGTFGGVTTAGQALIASYVATNNDQTGGSWSGQANANLASVTERHDAGTAAGQGGGIMLVTGTKETPGATGNTTATQSNTRAYCWITVALIYAPSGGTDALDANDLDAGAPTLGTPTIGQAHALSATAIDAGTPVMGSPGIAQIHALAAMALSAGTPILGIPAIGQLHALSASGMDAGTPTVGTPSIGQAHVLSASELATPAPTLGMPALDGNLDALIANSLSAGTPDMGAPAFGQVHTLAANDVDAGEPVMGEPTVYEVNALISVGLSAGEPVLGIAGLAQVHGLSANGLLAGTVDLGSPSIGQRHILVANDLSTGEPDLGSPAMDFDIPEVPPTRKLYGSTSPRHLDGARQSRSLTAVTVDRSAA